MLIVTEQTCREVVGRNHAFEAVEQVFAAMARGDAYNFPVIREAIGPAWPWALSPGATGRGTWRRG